MLNNYFKFFFISNSKLNYFFLDIDNAPTEKKFWTDFNNSKSLICKLIEKEGCIVQPIFVVLDLTIDIEKELSASQSPVTQKGFRVDFLQLL